MSLLSMQDVKEVLDKGFKLTPIGEFTYLRTYSRKIDEEQRREKWEETVLRFVNYSFKLYIDHMDKLKLPFNLEELKKEALELFESVYTTKQFPSGRSLWVGGTQIAEEYPLSNFNCAFTHVKRYEDLCQLFYVLLLGTGVGCKHELGNDCIEPMRNDIKVVHSKYVPKAKSERQEHTTMRVRGHIATIYIGDSKEGWVDALRKFFEVHSDEQYNKITKVRMVYDSIRPRGEELKRFGGTASGHESIKNMFENISKVIKNQIDEGLEPLEVVNGNYVKLRPIHILDIANFIGNNVVVGGVRRTAEIFLFSPNDYETLFAKYGINGIWTEEQREHHFKIMEMCEKLGIKVPKRVKDIGTAPLGVMPEGLHHRRMSNNSVAFKEKPSKELMELFVAMMRYEGEPGLINLESANLRRPNVEGLNPCAEILLDSKGVCNLTTIDCTKFITEDNKLDLDEIIEAQRKSVRIGIRMLLPDLELADWNETHRRDMLTGCSMTGFQDMCDRVGLDQGEQEFVLQLLREASHREASEYCKELRVPMPMLITTVKPEGTLSLVAGGVSPGIHVSHSEYFIRRIRISANTALAKAVLKMGWIVKPEVGFNTLEEAPTWVVEFPIKSGAKRTKADLTIEEQFNIYKMFQHHYTDHNTSNTMTVRGDEWAKLADLILKNWEDYVGVSFLSYDDNTYPLMPYEEITEEEYIKRAEEMPPFDMSILDMLDMEEYLEEELEEGDCKSGGCAIR